VFAISDLHLSGSVDKPMDIFGDKWLGHMAAIEADWASKVADDDVVLLAGDLSWAMNAGDAVCDIDRVARLKGRKVIIKGNHDYWWSTIGKVRALLPTGMYAIQNDCLRLDNVLICGSRLWQQGATSPQDIKILKREEIRLGLSLKEMSKMRGDDDKVIVMCHYPPFDVRYGDNAITDMIASYNVDAVVYGHLHGSDCRQNLIVDKKGIKYYLTSCDILNNQLIQVL
ncbi:MAG: metallophosphoesterase, partial [Clostridia bacterium]|nr:metallophosphoesterase [Clostridia bacterium]